MLKLLISCWYDGVVVACRYMFVLVLLLYCVSAGGGLTQHLNPSQTCNDMLLQHHHTNKR